MDPKETKKMEDVSVRKIEYPDKNGGISLTAESPAFAVLAMECVALFKKEKAINYCEWRLNSGDPSFGMFTVVIQREDGKTPAQVNSELRAERDEYQGALKRIIAIYQAHGPRSEAAILIAEEALKSVR